MANIKKLDFEELKKVSGGGQFEFSFSYVCKYYEAVFDRYHIWLDQNPNATNELKYQMLEIFMNEIYNTLDIEYKTYIDNFKNESPNEYKKFFETIVTNH